MKSKIAVTEDRIKFLSSLGLDAKDVNKWRVKWQRLIYHANRREIECSISFKDYVIMANEAGLVSPSEIGVSISSYQLARYGDTGPYSKENCRFVLRPQNILEWELNGGKAAMTEKLKGRDKESHDGILQQSIKVSKDFEVISPDGIIYSGTNLTDFCKVHTLNRGNMSSVCRGEMASYKGWTGKYI